MFLGLLIILTGGVNVCLLGQEAPHVVGLARGGSRRRTDISASDQWLPRFAKRFFGFPPINQRVRPHGIAIHVVGIELDRLLCRISGLLILLSVQENIGQLFEGKRATKAWGLSSPSR